jgi:hypothetical protein
MESHKRTLAYLDLNVGFVLILREGFSDRIPEEVKKKSSFAQAYA